MFCIANQLRQTPFYNFFKGTLQWDFYFWFFINGRGVIPPRYRESMFSFRFEKLTRNLYNAQSLFTVQELLLKQSFATIHNLCSLCKIYCWSNRSPLSTTTVHCAVCKIYCWSNLSPLSITTVRCARSTVEAILRHHPFNFWLRWRRSRGWRRWTAPAWRHLPPARRASNRDSCAWTATSCRVDISRTGHQRVQRSQRKDIQRGKSGLTNTASERKLWKNVVGPRIFFYMFFLNDKETEMTISFPCIRLHALITLVCRVF